MISDITLPFYQYILEGGNGLTPKDDALHALRQEALTRFRSLGLPDLKTEAWRNTNIQRILKEQPFILQQQAFPVTADQVAPAFIPGLSCYTAVLVNGHLQPELSELPAAKDVTVSKLSDAVQQSGFQAFFDKHPHLAEQPFAALNTALFADGLFLELKANAVLDKPLHIVHIYTVTQHAFLQPRHLWIAHPHAQATVIESSLGLHPDAVAFVNGVSEIVLEENAELWHYNLQNMAENSRHVHQTAARQQTYSRYHHYNFTLPHATLVRNNLSVALNGSYTETDLHGLYLATGQQHVDNHTFVDHLVPNCNSNELYKGVLLDNADGVFTGRIHVHQDAQKTNAFQQNNNLLLSDKANINSQPQLEIYADDVKCSHGFTVGQFSEESLFYLRSRGIGAEAARTLLVNAFAFDITDQVHIPALQQHLTEQIQQYVSRETISN
ncbi:Fe-S cluster assembly protein SufD [Chitinophaga japonensis]|uniref:Iron-regulated ABC transporter permease protein SufD n=1 Tax=Chitinophaga japonensis TaxID=104662 RepID=A0A562SMZ8_CHIJA|nr:Fe-S cluster assembly protein SufD [Chitinophaga japonensis]TWI82661.1 iron-regulated ABC transporter permease protein SufD [Chitinophaga japonensis]